MYDTARPICQTTVGASGTWSCTPADALSLGPHTIQFAQYSYGVTDEPDSSGSSA